MGVLAFPPDTHIWPSRDLLDPARWQMLSQQLRHNYWLHQLGKNCVHPHPVGGPLGHKDITVLQGGRQPQEP